MTKLKLLLIGLLTPLFCGVSFGITYDLFDNLNSNLILNTSLSQSNINISLHAGNYYCYYVDDSNYSPRNQINLNLQTDPGYGNCSFAQISLLARTNFCFMAACDNQYFAINPQSYSSATIKVYEFYEPISLGGGNSSCEEDLSTCISSLSTLQSNYNSCYNDKTSCLSSLSTLSGSLASCNSDLNSCQNNGSSCDTLYGVCVENLSGCNADKVSLNNNIDSLTLQLQNCLGQSCEGTGDIGTGSYFNQYSLYRTDDDIDYSTPITNNLFLPLGYKGKINEDNILSIAKINTLESAYQFSETDKPVVINSMGFVMLFFLGTGLLIVVIMYLRRFISKK